MKELKVGEKIGLTPTTEIQIMEISTMLSKTNEVRTLFTIIFWNFGESEAVIKFWPAQKLTDELKKSERIINNFN